MTDRMLQGVLFDCDGILLDSMTAWHAMEEHLADLSGNVLSPFEIELLNANTLAQTAYYFHHHYGVGKTVSELEHHLHARLLAFYRNSVHPKQGAISLVTRLHEAKIPLAIVSSSPRDFLLAGLGRIGIRDLFSVIASAETDRNTKRNPDFYREVAHRIGAVPAYCIGIDDSLYAIENLKEAGFKTIGVHDSDAAGSYLELLFAADLAVTELDEVDAEELLALQLNKQMINERSTESGYKVEFAF